MTAAGGASFIYIAPDNGTSTGIYRMTFDEAAANAGAGAALNVASEISVVLVGALDVADASTLTAGNFI